MKRKNDKIRSVNRDEFDFDSVPETSSVEFGKELTNWINFNILFLDEELEVSKEVNLKINLVDATKKIWNKYFTENLR